VGCSLVSFVVLSLSFFIHRVYSKQTKIKQLKLVGPIVEKLMPIGTEEDPEDIDEDSPSRVRIH
jgi:hypothetical protein